MDELPPGELAPIILVLLLCGFLLCIALGVCYLYLTGVVQSRTRLPFDHAISTRPHTTPPASAPPSPIHPIHMVGIVLSETDDHPSTPPLPSHLIGILLSETDHHPSAPPLPSHLIGILLLVNGV
jgi:hypothetical protein